MLPQDETTPLTETSAVNETDEQTVANSGKKPFPEPTLSISLNILDSTAFFQGSGTLDTADI